MRRPFLATLLLSTAVLLPACDDGGGGDPRVDDILALDGDATNGGSVFATTCGNSGCHGADGSSRSDADLVDIMINGSGSMAPQNISDQEAADVLAYIMTL